MLPIPPSCMANGLPAGEAEQQADARITIIPGAPHLSMVSHPGIITQVIPGGRARHDLTRENHGSFCLKIFIRNGPWFLLAALRAAQGDAAGQSVLR